MLSAKEIRKSKPSFLASLIPLIITGFFLFLSVFVYEAQPHIPIFFGAIAAGLVAFFHGYSWMIIEEGIIKSVSRAIPSLIILLIIGMLIGVWIASGIVPVLIYYGFQFLNPTWFLPSILILCSFMSIITGSSWTTIGTIGVAAIGIGQGLEIPAPITVGAIVSGAFFGDKLSPLSDSTNLTASILDVDIYDHIKHMLYTTLPCFMIALFLYGIIGFFFIDGVADTSHAIEYQEFIREFFVFSPWLALPPLAVVLMIIAKVPAIPSLAVGVILGGVMQIFIQDQNVGEFLNILYSGFEITSVSDTMNSLLSRGGMSSMYSVVALAIIALAFGGIMHSCDMLKSIVEKMSKIVTRTGDLVLTTLFTSIFINIFGANQYLAVILPGQMYKQSYKELGLDLKNLSRALEGGGTLTAPLIPWNSSGVFIMSVLSVSPLEFAPYAFICWLTMIIVAIFGYANITMEKTIFHILDNSTNADGKTEKVST